MKASCAVPNDLPCPVAGLIPHQPPMLLVDRVLESDATGSSGVVEAAISPDGLFVAANGTLDPVAHVELIAQGYAALQGLAARRAGAAMGQGFLVGARGVRVLGSARTPRAGEVLTIRLRTLGGLNGFALVHGQVLAGEELLAEGQVKVFGVTEPSHPEPQP